MDIFLYDDLHPEDCAMLQALYSRSPDTVLNHIDKVRSSDRGKFMERFYVGYGHASIGDCGTFTLFLEQISILAAKAIQNNNLYNGQEASTRYLDMGKQKVVDPYGTTESNAIQEKTMNIYRTTLEKITESIKKKYPFDDKEYKTEKLWENTMKARAFDVARGLLPAGVSTLVSWSTTLRSCRDNLIRLRCHPAAEVRTLAKNIFEEVMKKYPSSFNGNEFNSDYEYYKERNEFSDANAMETHYILPEKLIKTYGISDAEIESMRQGKLIYRNNIVDKNAVDAAEKSLLSTRPERAPLPAHLDSYGRYNMMFLLDYGSFRDVQRHRNGVCQIPLLTGEYGWNNWYMERFKEFLSPADFTSLVSELNAQFARIKALPNQEVAETQFYIPMGMNIMAHLSYTIPEMVYVSELRSNKTVHPSLRPIAQQIGNVLKSDFPYMKQYVDMDEASWIGGKRGEQTITEK
ncbi:MAG: FAD-dependent thymidylate synthase [Rickettsiales bacterium]|jgi:thymidylate synthase ThyX|nr:FAD-dependent thymidylate synthase [Rickettsiales bacterium]